MRRVRARARARVSEQFGNRASLTNLPLGKTFATKRGRLLPMNRAAVFSLMLTSLTAGTAGCSGSSVTDTGGGGSHALAGSGPGPDASSGSGGAAGTMPAQGNLTLVVHPPALGTANCPAPGRTYIIGNPQGPSSV